MGGFLLVTKTQNQDLTSVRKRCERSIDVFSRRGNPIKHEIDGGSFAVFLFDKVNQTGEMLVRFDNGDFVAAVGTLFYRGKIETAALEALYHEFDPEQDLFTHINGTFCVLLFKAEELYLFNDYSGVFHAFRDSRGEFWSSSFLAVRRCLKNETVSKQELFEYIAQGAMYANRTLFEEIRLVDAGSIHRLIPDPKAHPKKLTFPEFNPKGDFAEHVDMFAEHVLPVFAKVGNNFPDQTCMGLTGGYDSRLMLALVKKAGFSPKLHVYGGSSFFLADGFLGLTQECQDPYFATRIAEAEGLPIDVVDRDSYPVVSLERFPEVVEQRFLLLDGRGVEGAIDNGSDADTRLRRTRTSRLHLHGGGGECLRDVWRAPPWTMPLNRFLQGAFAEFNTDLDLSIYTEEFDKRQYFLNLREKFHSMLGISKDWITRQQVELVQPIIHQRYWMGVNNSANNSLAYTLNPLTDPVPALLSARVPWRYKLSGAFEAALTARLHERVARYPSRYGYDFAGPAPMSVRALDWLIAMCPLVVRPPLIRVAHRFRATRHHTPYWLTKDYLQTVVDLNNLEVSKYVRIERVVLPRLLNRVMTAELLLSNRF